jgi:protein-disulfide isomerase
MSTADRSVLPGLSVFAFGVAGVAISATIYALHVQLAADPNFASFCDVNHIINCDVVLSSRYATLFGVPVAVYGAAHYVAVALLGAAVWVGQRRAASARALRRARRAAGWLFALALFGLVYSGFLAGVAFFVIRAICLMCGGLYFVALAVFVAAWKARGQFTRLGAAERQRRDRWVMRGAVAVGAAVLGLAAWEALGPAANLDASDIATARPEFYKWYYAQPVRQVPADNGNVLGPVSAPITLVMYSDFECGHCASLARTLQETLPRYHGEVRMIFHHFPLDGSCNPSMPNGVHRSACRAAVAAECAAVQNRFWQYHDALFANQQRLDDASLLSYAARVGLDRVRFEACLASPEARARVQRDVESGRLLGIESTPTVFINGREIKGALPPDLMGYALRLALAPHTVRRTGS